MTNSADLMNPNGGEADWRGRMQPALETNLMERVLDSENLHRAWKQVKANQGRALATCSNWELRDNMPSRRA
jgi:hypothetical protein